MSAQPNRLRTGGRIDRTRTLPFSFDGKPMEGHPGDTLASALLANGVRLVGRSFKYHRPRGVLGIGSEEPNALIQLEIGQWTEPNLKATQIELYDGLIAMSQNRWPSLAWDVGALADLAAALLPAGFYYKTFMWPNWRWYDGAIRRVAGLGHAPTEPDPARYDLRFGHADVLVVGGGPAGLAAAEAALAQGRSVILADERSEFGGTLLDGAEGEEQRRLTLIEALGLSQPRGELTSLRRTTAVAYYDHNMVALVERLADCVGPSGAASLLRQRLWLVRARAVVLATGAIERPVLFPDNDRPGIMLASAVRGYRHRFGVLAGQAALVVTNNDCAYETAVTLVEAGASAVVVDSRPAVSEPLARLAYERGIELLVGHRVVGTSGAKQLHKVSVAQTGTGRSRGLVCDVLAMSGGWTPAVHLFSQSGGRLRFDRSIGAFVPDIGSQPIYPAGSLNGIFDTDSCVRDGREAGEAASEPSRARPGARTSRTEVGTGAVEPLAVVRQAEGRIWVDFQNDVTVSDIELAARENLVSVEHVKRYTTLGMAVDQGKTANTDGPTVLAEATNRSVAEVGTTRFRPPYVPVTIGLFRGGSVGDRFRPRRLLPAHDQHLAHGGKLVEYGGWERPAYYSRARETAQQSIRREALCVRNAVGLFDASPLGKIVVSGPEAKTLVGRIYANSMHSLAPGCGRYGLMLNEEGIIIDDGVALRLDRSRYLIGTTSAGAGRIADWLEEWHQCEWHDLRVAIAVETTAWTTVTVTGPKAREVITSLGTDIDLRPETLPHLGVREGLVAGVQGRIARVSFTGEVSFEISVAWDLGAALWGRLLDVGASFGIAPVGVEAWMLLRTEKGFLHVGADTDGTTTPDDVGWGRAVERRSDEFIGRRSLSRPENRRPDRLQFVGIEPADGPGPLVVGSHILAPGPGKPKSEGFVTSACDSPILGRWIGLALVRSGRQRFGEVLETQDLGRRGRVRLVEPGWYDRAGERLND